MIWLDAFVLGLCYDFINGAIYDFLPCTFWHFPIVKGIRTILQVWTIFSGKESVCSLIILLPIYLYISTKGPTPLFQIGEKIYIYWETHTGFNIQACLMFVLIAWYFCALQLANDLNIFTCGIEGNERCDKQCVNLPVLFTSDSFTNVFVLFLA